MKVEDLAYMSNRMESSFINLKSRHWVTAR